MAYADYQVTIATAGSPYVIGHGTDGSHKVAITNIVGIGSVATKQRDFDLGHRDGVYVPIDLEGPRMFIVDFLIVQARDAAACMAELKLARLAFRGDIDDTVTLNVNFPGYDYAWEVRGRGLSEDLSRIHLGLAHCQGTLIAPDPTPTGGW